MQPNQSCSTRTRTPSLAFADRALANLLPISSFAIM